MFGVQNWSRCSRHASRSICRHSARGSTDDAHAPEVDPAALARRRVLAPPDRMSSGLPSPGARAGACLRGPAASCHRAQSEAVDLVEQRLACASVSKSKTRAGPALPWPAAAVRADDRQHRPDDALPSTPAIWRKRPSGTGNGGHAAAMSVEIDAHVARSRCLRAFVLGGDRRGVKPLRRRIEGRRRSACSAIRYGRAARGKRQLEWTAVVDRVEGAQRQEVEIAGPRGRTRARSR